jgi:hypothetical protein
LTEIHKPPSEEDRRKRVVWLCSIANLTLVTLLIALWLKNFLTVEEVFIVAVPIILFVNGAVWFGLRLAARKNRSVGVLICFVAGAFGGADAIFEIASKDYTSAGSALTGCVLVVALGIVVMRNNAKKESGGSEHR